MAEPDQVAAMLDGVKQIRTHAARTCLKRACALLTMPVIREALVRQRLHRELTTERFNIFEILGLRENHHSRFLAFLLDPKAAHDQGARFLRTFVARLMNLPRYGQGSVDIITDWEGWSEHDWSRCRVRLENPAGEQGRIDVVLDLPDGTVIAIENKVNAIEGYRQLTRYWQWLNSSPNPNGAARLLVFLTPDGRRPTTAEDGDSVLLMSYSDLAEVLRVTLNTCPRTAIPLIATVEQYSNFCFSLHQGAPLMCEVNAEILGLLNQTAHLETALDIEQHLAETKKRIKNGFCRNFLKALKQRLQDDPAALERWQVTNLPEWREAFGLLARSHSKMAPRYACVAWIGFRNDILGGWRRPRDISGLFKPPAVEALEQQMQVAGFGEPHNWWLNLRYLNNEVADIRQPDLGPLLDWQKANVLAIHADNQNPDHPLATALADWLWARFTTFRHQVEQLPDFQRD